MPELERLQKAVVDTAADHAARRATADMLNAAVPYDADYGSDAAYIADLAAEQAGTAYAAYAKARDELEDYRNYKKAQLIQQLAEIVIRHDIENT
jgi:hypothetical protein